MKGRSNFISSLGGAELREVCGASRPQTPQPPVLEGIVIQHEVVEVGLLRAIFGCGLARCARVIWLVFFRKF